MSMTRARKRSASTPGTGRRPSTSRVGLPTSQLTKTKSVTGFLGRCAKTRSTKAFLVSTESPVAALAVDRGLREVVGGRPVALEGRLHARQRGGLVDDDADLAVARERRVRKVLRA